MEANSGINGVSDNARNVKDVKMSQMKTIFKLQMEYIDVIMKNIKHVQGIKRKSLVKASGAIVELSEHLPLKELAELEDNLKKKLSRAKTDLEEIRKQSEKN